MNFLMVLIGGGLGAVSRYALSRFVHNQVVTGFPLGTFIINLSGCFLIGILASLFDHLLAPPNLRLFILVGFLGGFTTFSSFGLESFNLLKEMELKYFLINVIGSNVLGIILVACGYLVSSTVINNISKR